MSQHSFTHSSGREILLLTQYTRSRLRTCYHVLTVYISVCLKYPQDFLFPSHVPGMVPHERSAWNVCLCNKQVAFVCAVIFPETSFNLLTVPTVRT